MATEPKLTVMVIRGATEIDEADVRRWFSCVDLDQASDTLMICVGIIQGRQAAAPKRKRRKDAGQPREIPDHKDQDRRLFEGTLERG